MQKRVAEVEVGARSREPDIRLLTVDATLDEWHRAIESAAAAIRLE